MVPDSPQPSPFPRTPDDLPQAWGDEEGRFTASYEKRAETVWTAITDVGFVPSIDLAGSQDGEAILACEPRSGELVMLLPLEDPHIQAFLDKQIAAGTLTDWVRARVNRPRKDPGTSAE